VTSTAPRLTLPTLISRLSTKTGISAESLRLLPVTSLAVLWADILSAPEREAIRASAPSSKLSKHVERVATAATNLGIVACFLEEVGAAAPSFAKGAQSRFALIDRAAWDDLQTAAAQYQTEIDAMLGALDKENHQ
jgi:hypothetical protein